MDQNKRAICPLRTMLRHAHIFAKFFKLEILEKLDWPKTTGHLCVFKNFNKEYFKIFETKNKQIREAATKEVFCKKEILKLLAVLLKVICFFLVSFIRNFSVRDYM